MRFAAFVTVLRVVLLRLDAARFLRAGPRFADDLRADDLRAEDLRALLRAGPFARALRAPPDFRALFDPRDDLRADALRPPVLPPDFLPRFAPPRDDFLAAMLRAPMLGFCCDTIATSAHKKQQQF